MNTEAVPLSEPFCITESGQPPLTSELPAERQSRFGKARLALGGLQLAAGLYVGSVMGSHASCTEVDFGSAPAEICADIDLLQLSRGGMTANLGVLGAVDVPDTHAGPVAIRITAQPFNIHSREVTQLADNPETLEKVVTAIGSDVERELRGDVERSLIKAAAVFALVNAVVWGSGPLYEQLRRTDGAALREITKGLRRGAAIGLGTVALGGLIMGASFNTDALDNAELQGPLQKVEGFSGDLQHLWENYQAYSKIMAEKSSYAYSLYERGKSLESSPQDSLRVMVVSDIHCNVGVYDSLYQTAKEAGVNVVVVTGDDTDYGSQLEEACLSPMNEFETDNGDAIQVLWIKGNHESDQSVEYVRTLSEVTILDRQAVEVDGVTFVGQGDPRYSSDPDQIESSTSSQMRDLERSLLTAVRQTAAEVVVVHDNNVAERIADSNPGSIRLIISGHAHTRSDQVVNDTFLHIEGSTGAGGARIAENSDNLLPIEFSILDLDKSTGAVVGGDLFTIDAYGKTMNVNVTSLDPDNPQPEDSGDTPTVVALSTRHGS